MHDVFDINRGLRMAAYAYLRHLFTGLLKAQTDYDIDALLPGNLSKNQIRTC